MAPISASCIHAGITLRQNGVPDDCAVEAVLTRIGVGRATQSSFDYQGALALARQHSWEMFSLDTDQALAFQETLRNFIEQEQPTWFKLFPYGRARVLDLLTENERQCFEIAGLTESLSDSVVAWWDDLAAVSRIGKDVSRLELGRDGERKTMRFEEARLSNFGLQPEWIALDDNLAGFDVKSWQVGPGQTKPDAPLYIEVKAAASIRRFFLSRLEWDFALRHESAWELQLWVDEQHVPIRLTVSQIMRHTPTDQGGGRWREIEVRLGEDS